MKVSIVISTKDRKNELIECLTSCVKLKSIHEILVYDDGSKDDITELIKSKFPTIKIYRSEVSVGLINARTKCANLISGDFILSIDDDCIFQETNIINELLPYFTSDKIAIVTIPCIDKLIEPNVVTQPGDSNIHSLIIASYFRGCAHILRREVFIQLGGYYDNLIRQEEETEFSMRLYNAGYFIRVGYCNLPILHFHSPIRNYNQISFYRMRNQIIVNYRLSPSYLVPLAILQQAFKTFIYEIRHNRFIPAWKGCLDAFFQIIKGNVTRSPMTPKAFFAYKLLRRNKILSIPPSDPRYDELKVIRKNNASLIIRP